MILLGKAYQTINRVLEKFMVIIFSLLIVDVLAQVFSRYLLSYSPSFTEEFARFSLIWLSLLGMAYLTGQREHLTMDYVYQKFSEQNKKKATIFIESIIILFATVVMLIGGGNLVYITLDLGQLSSALQIPLGYVYMVVPVSGLLIVFYSIHNISKVS
ncbi:TRAP transporter small permease [Reichenbachiella carrageenanivorans]|uniref:TRAP transporter small permease n=1 Tax=Reichenbachiella carrageenanivorans TaxID=2979869 RepID=A0ABY6D565_9BACT|nr:TRAP transporter small permease [Reichenbachiella carrageenanivorans]UXX81312.1 TRAP transporter small permease [Reichenbachiella carrageenanivorans]